MSREGGERLLAQSSLHCLPWLIKGSVFTYTHVASCLSPSFGSAPWLQVYAIQQSDVYSESEHGFK